MLLDLEKLVARYEMKANGVLHLGAHLAEEAPSYDHVFPRVPVWWIEAIPDLIPKVERQIAAYPAQKVVQGLVYSEPGVELAFNVTNYDGMSSSIFEFGTHPDFSPDTLFVQQLKLRSTTVDDLVEEHGIVANLLNMDLQGAELHALLGAEEFLRGVDYVYTEINKAEVYQGCAKVHELDAVLSDFQRVETSWVLTTLSRSRGKVDDGWGDALYVRK